MVNPLQPQGDRALGVGEGTLQRAIGHARPFRWLGYGLFLLQVSGFGRMHPTLLLLAFLLLAFELLYRWSHRWPALATSAATLPALQLVEASIVLGVFLLQPLPLASHLLFSASLVLANLALCGFSLALLTAAVGTVLTTLQPPPLTLSPATSELLLPLLLLWIYACGFSALGYRRAVRLSRARDAAQGKLSALAEETAHQLEFLPGALRQELAGAGRASKPARERCWLVIGFLDLCDFAALTQRLDATALERVFEDFLQATQASIATHGGLVAKVLGDGLLVYWRPVGDREDRRRDCAMRAVACSRALHQVIQQLGQQARERGELLTLEARVAMTSGYCSFGAWGRPQADPSRTLREYTVLGATVNRAARLQQVALPGATVLDEALAALVEADETLAPLTTAELKGIGETRYRVLLRPCQNHLTLVS